MVPYGPPIDLEEFWVESALEAEDHPLELWRSPFPDREEGDHFVYTYSFRGIRQNRIHGWVAIPKESPRDNPAFLWVPPYGRESLLPNGYGTRKGFVSASLNFHGLEAFHQESYRPDRGYFADGLEEPRTWIFRSMFQDAILAIKALRTFSEVDADRIGSMGMSQGGGISLWLGAWCRYVKVVCSDMPFLGGMADTLGRPSYRYPQKELVDFAAELPMGHERVLYTLSYFDTVHQAAFSKVPTQISLGLRDPAVRPETARRVYESLVTEKRLVEYPGGHDWDPDMIDNNRDWLMRFL